MSSQPKIPRTRSLGEGRFLIEIERETEYRSFMPAMVKILDRIIAAGFQPVPNLKTPPFDWTTDVRGADFRADLSELHSAIRSSLVAGGIVKRARSSAREARADQFEATRNQCNALISTLSSPVGSSIQYLIDFEAIITKSDRLSLSRILKELTWVANAADTLLHQLVGNSGAGGRADIAFDSLSSREIELIQLERTFRSYIAKDQNWSPKLAYSKTMGPDAFSAFVVESYGLADQTITVGNIQRTYRRALARTNLEK